MIQLYPVEPTPESYRDRGELDGVPIRTLADVQREECQRLARIAACAKAQASSPLKGVEVELIPAGAKKGTRYPSMKAAARAIGINPSNISNQLRKYPMLGGYRWKVRGRK